MHLQTMVDLCVAEFDCGTAQTMIDVTRQRFASDGDMQLALDVKQTELDEKLRRIIHAQMYVAHLN